MAKKKSTGVIMNGPGFPSTTGLFIVSNPNGPPTVEPVIVASDPPKEKAPQIRITQSMIKDLRAFDEGRGCGILIKEKWIKGRQFDMASAAMELGMYFEFVLTGSKPKSGVEPKPKFMVSKVKANGNSTVGLGIADMYDDYRTVHANVQMVREFWDEMGIAIYEVLNNGPIVGQRIVKGRFEGTLDCIMVALRDIEIDGLKLKKGDLFIMDIKYSGLIDDKWSEMGWMWTDEQKKYHGTQAKHYSFLKPPLPFVFFVVAPSGNNAKFFHMNIDQATIDAYISEANFLYDRLGAMDLNDELVARPEYSKCKSCPLFNECIFRHKFPHPVTIDLREVKNEA